MWDSAVWLGADPVNVETGAFILNAFGVILTLLAFAQIQVTYAIHGGFSFETIKAMAAISARSSKVLLLGGGIVGLLQCVAPAGLLPPMPRMLTFGLSVMALNAACLPPALLFLGASRQEGFLLANELGWAIPPLKLVHLLHSFSAGSLVGDQLSQNEFRVGKDWQKAVRDLSELARLVVVDTRVVTEPILTEIHHLIARGLLSKVIFVVNDDLSSPALASLATPANLRPRVITAKSISKALAGVGWYCRRARSDEPLKAALLSAGGILRDEQLAGFRLSARQDVIRAAIGRHATGRPNENVFHYQSHLNACLHVVQSLRESQRGAAAGLGPAQGTLAGFMDAVDADLHRLAHSFSELEGLLTLQRVGAADPGQLLDAAAARLSRVMGTPMSSGTATVGLTAEERATAYVATHMSALRELASLYDQGVKLDWTAGTVSESARRLLAALRRMLETANVLFSAP